MNRVVLAIAFFTSSFVHVDPPPTNTTPSGAASAESSAATTDQTPQTPGLRVGDKAPDVTLIGADGNEVRLGDLYPKGPMIVTFYRGGWCPFCSKALRAWDKMLPEVKSAGGTFLAVTPEKQEHAAATGAAAAPSMPIVTDARGDAARAFRIAFTMNADMQRQYKGYGVDLSTRNTSGLWEVPAPATFVIDREGIVRWVFADWDYRKRAEPAEAIEALRRLGR